jgi:hypothetical protein
MRRHARSTRPCWRKTCTISLYMIVTRARWITSTVGSTLQVEDPPPTSLPLRSGKSAGADNQLQQAKQARDIMIATDEAGLFIGVELALDRIDQAQ